MTDTAGPRGKISGKNKPESILHSVSTTIISFSGHGMWEGMQCKAVQPTNCRISAGNSGTQLI